MVTVRHRSVLFLLAVALLLAAGACSSSDKKSTGGSSTGGSAGGGGTPVMIKGFKFGPNPLTVKAGTKVTFTNEDSDDHTATADSGAAAKFDSGHLAKGKAFTFAFAKPGTYSYHCKIHTYMTASVKVS